jgi:AcrR family transcriptional regulator
VTDIGATVGITGPAIYRHFDGKPAVLVALFDRAIDLLLADARGVVGGNHDRLLALNQLVDHQVDFVVSDRELAQVYYTEIHNLPNNDRRRLRRKQRLYLEEWIHLLHGIHDDLDLAVVRTTVHAAIGAIQSALFHGVGLRDDELRTVLASAARSVLGITPPTRS